MRNSSAFALLALLLASCDFFEPHDVYLTPEEVAALETRHGPLDKAEGDKLDAVAADVEAIVGAPVDTSKRIEMLENAKGERGAQVTLKPPAAEAVGDGLAGFLNMIIENPTGSGVLAALPLGLAYLFQLIAKRQQIQKDRAIPKSPEAPKGV